ncbi:cache domain-containing protein [Aeromicrobium phragmitis]|uniref:cache domain-containing protein n=1 Tax=Aeromicrobium phragmitis TaxID=2478914 RepID=UPI000EF6CE87|nr:cache domain-containing protein [Aeromicrobium phragmitis]
MNTTGEHSDRGLRRAARDIITLTEPLFDALAELAEACRRDVDLTLPRPFDDEASWSAFAPAADHVLRTHVLATGVGAAVIGEESADGTASMAWWIRRDGHVSRKRHVMNPQSDSFYDVRHLRWFRVPMATGRPALFGPYVDSWGTDDITLTAAVALIVDDRRVGVVAADLDTRQYLDLAEAVLRETGVSALLDDEDRVVVSSDPSIDTGSRIASLGQAVTGRETIDELNWSLARLGGQSANRS